MIWWVVSARHWFKGPKVNLEHLMLDRDDQAAALQHSNGDVLEGKDADRSSSEEGEGGIMSVPGKMPSGKQVGDMKPEGL